MAEPDTRRSEPLEGRYANAFQVGHNAFEFVLEFGQGYNDEHEGVTHTRIVTGPSYAKALCETLQAAIARYEREFGALPAAPGLDDE